MRPAASELGGWTPRWRRCSRTRAGAAPRGAACHRAASAPARTAGASVRPARRAPAPHPRPRRAPAHRGAARGLRPAGAVRTRQPCGRRGARRRRLRGGRPTGAGLLRRARPARRPRRAARRRAQATIHCLRGCERVVVAAGLRIGDEVVRGPAGHRRAHEFADRRAGRDRAAGASSSRRRPRSRGAPLRIVYQECHFATARAWSLSHARCCARSPASSWSRSAPRHMLRLGRHVQPDPAAGTSTESSGDRKARAVLRRQGRTSSPPPVAGLARSSSRRRCRGWAGATCRAAPGRAGGDRDRSRPLSAGDDGGRSESAARSEQVHLRHHRRAVGDRRGLESVPPLARADRRDGRGDDVRVLARPRVRPRDGLQRRPRPAPVPGRAAQDLAPRGVDHRGGGAPALPPWSWAGWG